jgi:hypothetical protein
MLYVLTFIGGIISGAGFLIGIVLMLPTQAEDKAEAKQRRRMIYKQIYSRQNL